MPAVMVPPLPNAGRSRPSPARSVSGRMPSSAATSTSSPRRCGIRTPTISAASTPDSVAACARWWERAAKASWSSRVTATSPVLQPSVSAPIAWSVNTSHSPS